MAGNAETNNKVEERIIAAKFDSSDFEKGVDKTIKKLDELKDNLKFEKTGESIADLSKKTKDAQESATKSIEKLTDRYTNFVGMIKQKLLSGIADQVVGVFFRMEQAALRFTKSMTFDQISMGMAKYESMLTAVRMITNSYKTVKNEITGVAEKIHYTQDEAYTAMRNLQDYADETSYSIEQMSDSMSKMVAAGVSLSQAEKNVQGIANACAAAGVNATDAARAFFNLSQAYSSGSLKYTDYRSLELLNMTNENFQEKMLEAAVKAGTLKVVKGKNGAKTYKTQKSKTNKKVTAGKTVTKQSLAESLRYGFMDKDAMDYLFGNNFYVDVDDFYDVKDQTEELRGKAKTARRKELLSQIKDEEGVKKYIEGLKDTSELKKTYKEFNNDEERGEFIKNLIEEAEQINKIAKKYNGIDASSVKDVFSKLADDDERRVTYRALKTEKEKKEYIKTLEENAELVQGYIDKENKANGIIDKNRVESYVMSLDPNDERFKRYNELRGGGSQARARAEYIEKLSKDAKTIKEIQEKEIDVTEKGIENYILSLDKNNKYRQKYEKLDIEGRKKYLKELTRDADIAKKANKKSGTFDEEALEKYIMSLDKTNARRAKYEKLSAAERKKYLKDMAEQAAAIGKLGRKYDDVAIEAFLAAREARNLGDVIKAVGDYVSSKWTKVFENLIGQLDDASDFFTDLSEGGIASLFTDFADWISDVSEAFNEGGVGSANFRNMILELDAGLGNLLGIFNDLLPNTEDFGYQLMVISGDLAIAMQNFNIWTQKVRAWVTEEDRITKIQGIFANLSGVFTIVGKTFGIAFNTIAQALHVVAPILDAVFVALNKITEPIGRLGARENTEPFEKLQNAINNFFGVLAPASETAAPVIEKIGEILGIIGDFFVGGAIDTIVMNINFFADAFSLLLELLGVQTVEKKNGQSVLEGLQKDVASFAQTCKDAVKTVGEFFDSLFIDLRKLFNLEPKAGKEGVEGGGFFANIKNFFETNEFIQNAKAWLAKAKTDVEAWFNKAITDVGNWISNFPETLSNLLNQELWTEERKKTVKHDDGTEETITEEYTYTLSNIIENIKNNVIAWFNQAVEDVKKWVTELPQKISDAFTTLFYTKEKQHGNRHKRLYGDYVWVETPLKVWLDGVVDSVGKFVANIPNYVLQGIDKVIDIFGLLIGAVFGTNKDDVSKEGEQSEKTASTAIHEWATNFINTLKTELRLLPARIKGFILLQKARISIAFRNIKTWFNTTETGKAIKDWTVSMVNSIKEFIVKLPEHIKDAVKAVGSLGRSIISTVKELFSGKEIADETQKELEEGVKGISLGGVLASIADIGATIINEFVSWFSGTDNIEQNISWFVSTVGGFIISIPERIWNTIKGIGKELSGVWTYISTLLTSDSEGNEAQNATASDFEKAHPTIANIINGAVNYIKGLPDSINEEVGKVADKLSHIWDVLISAINGDSINKRIAQLTKNLQEAEEQGVSSRKTQLWEEELKELKGENGPIERAVASIGEYIGSIPGKLKEFSDNLAKEVSGFWPGIVGIITKNNREAELEKLIRDRSTSSLERAEYEEELRQIRIPSDFEQEHPQIAAFVTSAQKWIEGIPGTLRTAYNTLKDKISEFFSEFAEFWNNTIDKDHGTSVSSEDSEDKQATAFEQNHPMIAGWITSAVTWIKSIPDQLNAAITTAMDDIATAWGQFTEYLSVLDRRRQLEAMIPDQNLSPRERANYQKELYELNKPTAFEKEHPTIARLTETITGWVSDIPDTISSTWTSVTTAISGFWDDLVKAFRGDNITEDVGDGEKSLGQRLRDAIINFFANLPKYVTDGIQMALDLINSAISGITGVISGAGAEDTVGTVTEKIKEEAENVVASLEETTEQVTNEAADSTKKMAEDASKNADSPKNGFVDGIVKIGQTLWTIITETIPGFISSGFEWIKDHWNDEEHGWGKSLRNMFSGLPGIDSLNFDLSGITDRISKAFEDLPGSIRGAIARAKNAINGLFKKQLDGEQKNYIETSFGPQREAILDQYERLGYDISKYRPGADAFKGIQSFASSLGEGIKVALTEAFNAIGPLLLQGWNGSISLLSTAFSAITKLFSGETEDLGEAVNEVAGAEISEENKSLIATIGNTISDFILNVIPSFLGSAIGTLITELPAMWDKFWQGLVSAFHKSEEKASKDSPNIEKDLQEPAEAATTALATADNMIENVMRGFEFGTVTTGAAVIAGLFLLFKIFDAIKELINTFNVTGNIAERAEAKNSIEAVFKRMLLALMAGMALVVYASQLDDNQFAKVKSTFDAIADLLKVMAVVYTIGKGIDLTDDIFAWKSGASTASSATASATATKSRVDKLKDAGTSLIEGASGATTGLLSKASSMLGIGLGIDAVGGSVSDLISSLTGNFEEIGAAMNSFSSTISSAAENLAKAKENIETGLTTLELVIDLVGKMKEISDKGEDVEIAKKAIRQMRLSLGSLAEVFRGELHTTELIGALNEIMGMTESMQTFSNFVKKDDTFKVFKDAIAALGGAMMLYDGVNINSSITTEGIQNAITILKSILQNEELMGIAKEFKPENFGTNSSDMLEMSERLIVFASSIARIGAAFKDFSGDSATGLEGFIQTVQKMTIQDTIIEDGADAGAGLTSFSEKMVALGDGLSHFAESIGDFNEKDVKNAQHALDMVQELASRLDETGKSWLGKLFSGGTSLTQFGEQLETLGTHVQQFMVHMRPLADENGEVITWNFDYIYDAMYAVTQLANAASVLNFGSIIDKSADIGKLKELLSEETHIGSLITTFLYDMSIIKDKYGMPVPTEFNFSNIRNAVSAFNDFTTGLGALKGLNINNTIRELTSDFWYNEDKKLDKVTDNADDHNGISKLIDSISTIYTRITDAMRRTDGKEYKIDIAKVKLYFSAFSDFLLTIRSAVDNTMRIELLDSYTGTANIKAETRSATQVITETITAVETLTENVDKLFDLIDALGEYQNDDRLMRAGSIVTVLRDVSTILQNFSSGIQSGALASTSSAIEGAHSLLTVDTNLISEALKKYLEAVQSALNSSDEAYHPVITPVFKSEDLKQQMADLFGVDANMKLDFSSGFAEAVRQAFGDSETFSSMNQSLGSIDGKLDDLKTVNASIGELQSDLRNAAAAITSLQVRLDTGVLVGELTPGITALQDRYADYYVNHITTPTFSLEGSAVS